MELLRQLLQADNISIPNLEVEIKNLGYDPKNITEDETLTIVGLLKEKFSNGITKRSKKQSEKLETKNVDVATEKAVKQVDSLVFKYQELSDKVVEKKSSQIIAIIENIPNATMARVKELLDDSEGNLDFFLNETEHVEKSFLSKFGIE